MVAYVQHDNSRIKWRNAYFNTFVAPIVYPFGLICLLILNIWFIATSRLKRIWKDKQGNHTP